ncbi:MAG: hypothetical protein AAF078_07490, partial [Planctomycetota bacterium]
IGGFICCLIVLPNPMSGRLGILFVGGFVAVVGGLLYWVGVRAGRTEVTEQDGESKAETA